MADSHTHCPCCETPFGCKSFHNRTTIRAVATKFPGGLQVTLLIQPGGHMTVAVGAGKGCHLQHPNLVQAAACSANSPPLPLMAVRNASMPEYPHQYWKPAPPGDVRPCCGSGAGADRCPAPCRAAFRLSLSSATSAALRFATPAAELPPPSLPP